jgi:hypothetical protein
MPVGDIANITRALIYTVEEHVKSSPTWIPRPAPTVVPLPPERLSEGNLGMFLYHVVESPHTKNITSDRITRFHPMGLDLYYQMCVQTNVDTDVKIFSAQLLFGLAVKAFHANPVLSDTTLINGVAILAKAGIDGDDNAITVSMLPTQPQESTRYWETTNEALKLSSYYLVSTAYLEPEEPSTRTGRVYQYGAFAFAAGHPYISHTQNRITFTPPMGPAQEVDLRPAVATYGEQFTLTGAHFTGDVVDLSIERSDGTGEQIADINWQVKYNDTTFEVAVQPTISGTTALPGFYTIAVRTSRTHTLESGITKTFEDTSNRASFAIAPQVQSVSAPDANGVFTVTGSIFQDGGLDPADVVVYLGAERASTGAAGSLNPGEYAILGPTQIEVRLVQVLSGTFTPLRIIVRGVESHPRWVEVV